MEFVACMRVLYVFLNMRVGRGNLTLGDVGAISGLSSKDLGYLRQFGSHVGSNWGYLKRTWGLFLSILRFGIRSKWKSLTL